MKRNNIMMTLLALAVATTLSAQRVYTIYPVPQKQQALEGKVSFTPTVNIVADPTVDQPTIDRAKTILTEKGLRPSVSQSIVKGTSNVLLGVNGSKGTVDKALAKTLKNRNTLQETGKFDRHILTLTNGGNNVANLAIVGEHTDATFCGLASLEQMLDGGTNDLPTVRIDDYADIQYRGVIEGYYGVPYTEEVTKDLFRFMQRYKMNCYMYGAKSDPYHTQKWAEPYPTTITSEQKAIGYLTQDMMRSITNVAQQCKVNFIWAIHPGQDFTDAKNNKVIGQIMDKFDLMYNLGVRQFGVFVDDVGVPTQDDVLKLNAQRISEVQKLVEKKWNTNYTTPADTVKPIHFVPQLYAYTFNTAEVCQRFFSALSQTPKNLVVYITGAQVWSVPNTHDLDVVKKHFGRDLAWWWNYPCNDNDVTKLFVRDTYSNFRDESWINNTATLPRQLRGATTLISNPMQQGAASKIALFGVGNYAWNNAGFENADDYHAAVKAVVGQDQAKAYIYLAEYLTYHDTNPMAAMIERYKENGNGSSIKNEMKRIIEACQSINQLENHKEEGKRLFYADIKPFVKKVEDMAQLTTELINELAQPQEAAKRTEIRAQLAEKAATLDQNAAYHFAILRGMGNDIKLEDKVAQPSATTLQPFIEWLGNKLK